MNLPTSPPDADTRSSRPQSGGRESKFLADRHEGITSSKFERPRMTKGQLQEQLVRLYLRLNGFFTSGFIAHSPVSGRNRTEVDFLGVRFRYHSEAERIEPDDTYLDLSDRYLEFAICEVKSRGQDLRFNEGLFASKKAIASILHRAGIFAPATIPSLIPQVQSLLTPSTNPSPVIPCIVVSSTVRIRALLLSPDRNQPPRHNQAWFVCGKAIIGHITRCLCPVEPRSSCATNYGSGQWADLAALVAYFKNQSFKQPISIKYLFKHFDVQ